MPGSDDPWVGVVYVLLGLVSAGIFVSFRGSVNTTGIAASGLVVLYGLSTAFVSLFHNPVANANDRWSGCFWLLIGLGIIGFVIVFPLVSWARLFSGLVLGAGIAIYGLLTALGS